MQTEGRAESKCEQANPVGSRLPVINSRKGSPELSLHRQFPDHLSSPIGEEQYDFHGICLTNWVSNEPAGSE